MTATGRAEEEAVAAAQSRDPPEAGRDDPDGRADVQAADESTAGGTTWEGRSWWAAAGIILVLWSLRLVGYVSAYPVVVPLVVLGTLWGLVALMTAWRGPGAGRSRSARGRRLVYGVTATLILASFGAWALMQILQAPGFGTDEMAFDQYAAHLLAHGVNPYTRSMAPAFPLFHVQPDGYTYLVDGRAVTSLSYPAMSFLLYVPILLLGFSTQVAVAVNVVAWMAVIVVLFALLPPGLRPMALVVGSLSAYATYAVGGVTVALYVPFLAGALWRWRTWPDKRGVRAWVSPALMGLAVSVNQVPWLVLPFLLAGVAVEAGRAGRSRGTAIRTVGRYLAMTAAVAAIPNLPFLVWSPHAWFSGILTPLTSRTVPAGQGLVELSLYLHLGGGSLALFSLLALLALAASLAAFVAAYDRVSPLVGLLAVIPLLLATRSYASYLFGLVPIALIGAVAGGRPHPAVTGTVPARPPRARLRWSPTKWAAAGLAVATVATALAATTDAAPLAIHIVGVTTTGQLATVEAVSLMVRNRGGTTVSPHFTLSSGDSVTTFWLVQSGPDRLAPGQQAAYRIVSPNFYAQPPVDGGFQVVAFTTSPSAVSHSGSYLPTNDHVVLDPDAVNRPVAIGAEVVLHAELVDRLDRPVHRAGVPVYLGQIIYAQSGLEYGEAIINSGQPGQTPVSVLTNADGVATFTVVGTQASSDPTYFEANLVNSTSFYPYGYSQIVPIRFGS